MSDNRKTLLQGLIAAITLMLSNEQMLNGANSDKLMLISILSILTLMFSGDQLLVALKEVVNRGGDFLKLPVLKKPVIEPITPREKEVLALMVTGMKNKAIAEKLFISDATVKNHVTSILRKLNSTARTEAVVTAIKYDLVDINTVGEIENGLSNFKTS